MTQDMLSMADSPLSVLYFIFYADFSNREMYRKVLFLHCFFKEEGFKGRITIDKTVRDHRFLLKKRISKISSEAVTG